jgi:hypothetical protein
MIRITTLGIYRIFFVFLFVGTLFSEDIREFKVGDCVISSKLNKANKETAVYVSHRLLEGVIKDALLKKGLVPQDGDAPFVKFDGETLHINGKYKVINLTMEFDGGFYQTEEQKGTNEFSVNFGVEFSKKNKNFLGRLADFVTMPIGLIFETVVSVVMSAISTEINVEDYLGVNVEGGSSPLNALARLGASFINIFLPADMQIQIMHRGVAKITLQELSVKVLQNFDRIEIGSTDKAVEVYVK